MYIIVGLGNPGRKYKNTRHNMGFLAIDALAKMLGTKVNKAKFRAKVGEGVIAGEKIVLAKPQTFMNLSGDSVREIADFYKIERDHLIVIYDDFDIPLGSLRIRRQGGPGTHNGMKSVIRELGYDDFPRIRIGTGTDSSADDAIKFVIGKISKSEKETLEGAAERAAEAARTMVVDGSERAMNIFNGHN